MTRKMITVTKWWNSWISSAMGVTASWKPICLGEGWPAPANAGRGEITAPTNPARTLALGLRIIIRSGPPVLDIASREGKRPRRW